MALSDALLGILASGPAHGYDLKRAYDNRFSGSRPLAYGQVYATLTRLQRDDLVEVVEVAQESGPERTVYAMTASGEESLRDWLEKTEAPGPYPAEELVRKTVTALHLGADALGFVSRQRAAHLTLLRDLAHLQRETKDAAARITVDHLIFHLDADLRWLEAAAGHIAEVRRPQ